MIKYLKVCKMNISWYNFHRSYPFFNFIKIHLCKLPVFLSSNFNFCFVRTFFLLFNLSFFFL